LETQKIRQKRFDCLIFAIAEDLAMSYLKLFTTFALLTVCAVATAESMSIDDESFGVFYETPMNTNKGLILYISNKNCFGNYRVANNELVIGNGEINARGPEKVIPFGTTKFRVDCGPQQSLVLSRE
jgi:hypothetical protein